MIFKPVNDREKQTAPEPVRKHDESVVAKKTTAKQVRTKTSATSKRKDKTAGGKI